MSTSTTSSGATSAPAKKAKKGTGYLSTMALVMMNVTIIAALANDVQQSFYGLSSVTFFAIAGLVFFIPTGLVAAELASGWSQRGGIFRWVGEGIGPFAAISCLLILWMQMTFNFGAAIPNMSATIGFYTPDYNWAVDFAEQSHSWTVTLPIMIGWLVYYWVVCFLATKGVKVFSKIAKFGVILGTFLPLAIMVVLAVVWLAQGNRPNIDLTPAGLIPEWHGMTTLALAAGVFFSFAGIDMNAAHIKDLKNPNKQFPLAIFISMILSFAVFVIGTLIIAIVIPENQINLLYTLYATFRELGAAIGFPDLYMVIMYLLMANSFAALITNLAGPSFMLGQAGRSGFLPKFLQSNNKHGMPSRLMYTQMALMTVIAFVVFLLPNVEGFVALVTQAITILYLAYYVLMFVAFLRLRYQQPNRPRGFRVPGGNVGAWIVAGIGIIACAFGIVLAYIPPAQIAAEVGSPVTYVVIITVMLAFVVAVCVGMYRASRKHNWVDPTNDFAPFTWEIEGLKKPQKVLSNVPSEVMSEGQNPMGMPIKRPYKPDEMVNLPSVKDPKAQASAAQKMLDEKGIVAPDPPAKVMLAGSPGMIKLVSYAPPVHNDNGITKAVYREGKAYVPPATEAEIGATAIPNNPADAARLAQQKAAAAQAQVKKYQVEEQAFEDQMKADEKLLQAQRNVKSATAAAVNAEKAAAAPAAQAAAEAAAPAPAVSSPSSAAAPKKTTSSTSDSNEGK